MSENTSTNQGRSPEVSDEELLNVIRRSKNVEVPTKDIYGDPSVSIGDEAVRKRLNKLEDQDRLSSRSAGTMRMWQLGELETDEPVRQPAMATARRWSNLTKTIGQSFAAVVFGLLFGSVLFFIIYLHSQTGDIQPLFLTEKQILVSGYVFAYTGAIMAVLTGVVYGGALAIPKLVAWRTTSAENEPTAGGDT